MSNKDDSKSKPDEKGVPTLCEQFKAASAYTNALLNLPPTYEAESKGVVKLQYFPDRVTPEKLDKALREVDRAGKHADEVFERVREHRAQKKEKEKQHPENKGKKSG